MKDKLNGKEFSDIPEFARGYFMAAFFTDCSPDNPELDEMGFSDMLPETVETKVAEVMEWRNNPVNNALFERVHDGEGEANTNEAYGEEYMGHDLWYTSNHHGVGYWDRGLGELGEDLSKQAHTFSEASLYKGDDGHLYFE